jgi:hypothetical protein
MKTLATKIAVPNVISEVCDWSVVGFQYNDGASPPFASVQVQLRGDNGQPLPSGNPHPFGQTFTLMIYDSTEDANFCLGLMIHPEATSGQELIGYKSISVPGAYTAIMNAFYNSSGKEAITAAVEALLLSTGIMSADFAAAAPITP